MGNLIGGTDFRASLLLIQKPLDLLQNDLQYLGKKTQKSIKVTIFQKLRIVQNNSCKKRTPDQIQSTLQIWHLLKKV